MRERLDVTEGGLLACCASRRWAAEVAAGRPYADLAGLRAASAKALAGLAWADVEEALDAHPRIGDRPRSGGDRLRSGGDRPGSGDREAAWSRGEQSGMDAAAAELRTALVEGNRAYEERFGHVFLICATGLSAAEMLGALRERLGNDAEAERAVVRTELAKIVDLRLAKLAAEPAEGER
ncbi:2-oxo-4-hydroxy-4-carboxy-5-ureidoimidazoline decarboxylase [Actinomadura sp. NTSP31]|uniref:2-oxo-4-hydroxy-4-carboxy-5-ureidoimidazoline decarboxylase n=1 Tax=Actinomadura sp. NTSP31 TaxID=1735447 RepID=UPI0035BFFA5D